MGALSETISSGMLEILSSQWSTLGAFLSTRETTRSVVDPEAALAGACSIGRADPRLFDEVLDWLAANADFIKPTRLNRLARDSGPDAVRVLAAAVDCASEAAGREILSGAVERGRQVLPEMKEENLFSHGGFNSNGSDGGRRVDPVFLRWGLMRSKAEVRHQSSAPDLSNPANVMTVMRKHYGQTARADVLTYLMTGPRGSSYRIARMIGYNQSTVYRELEKMSKGGPVTRHLESKDAPFWVDKKKLAASVGLKQVPVFFDWAGIYKVYRDAVSTLDKISGLGEREVLAIEAAMDLSARIVPVIRDAGEPLSDVPAPDAARVRGKEGASELLVFLQEAMGVLREFTVQGRS